MFPRLNVHGRRTVIVGLAALALVVGASAQMGLGLAPMRVELNLAPGAAYSGMLSLANNSTGAIRVVGETLDFYLDATATPQFARDYPREASFSCRSWLVANPMETDLNSGGQIQVRYTLRVPSSATARSYHCALGFTTQPTSEDAKALGLRAAVQIVAAIYVVVGNPRLDGAITDLKLESVANTSGSGWRAVVTIRNAGLMHFRPEGVVDVLDEGGNVVETEKFVPMPVLPQRDQDFLFPLHVSAGLYKLRARVDIGGAEIQEATASVVAARSQP